MRNLSKATLLRSLKLALCDLQTERERYCGQEGRDTAPWGRKQFYICITLRDYHREGHLPAQEMHLLTSLVDKKLRGAGSVFEFLIRNQGFTDCCDIEEEIALSNDLRIELVKDLIAEVRLLKQPKG